MQKQRLFQIFSCINHYAPELFGANRMVNNEIPGVPKLPEAPKVASATTPDKTEEKGDAVLEGAKRAAEKFLALGDKLEKINPLVAAKKVAESIRYLQKQNKDKNITQERLVDALKEGDYLKSAENPPSPVDMMNAIRAMQRDLGFTNKGVDGEIGKNTYGKMAKEKPDMYATLTGTAKQGKPEVAAVQEKPELPAGRKAEVEAQLSQISDTIQMNYKTVARLQDELFKTDGTLKQSPNTDDLTGYKAALDNISEQLKTVDGIEGALKEYKVPANFMLTITNQSGDTKSSRVLQCTLHNEFFIPKSTLFSVDGTDGRVFARHYEYMQKNFENRLAEFKTDYDHIVKDWAQRVAGKEGRTGNDVEWQNLHKIFENEPVPAVLALLGIKTEKFNVDVEAATDTILAERNAKEDKEMASTLQKAREDLALSQGIVVRGTEQLKVANGRIDIRQKASHQAQEELRKATEAVRLAESPTASEQEKKDMEAKKTSLVDAKQYAENSLEELQVARSEATTTQRVLALAEQNLLRETQALAALEAKGIGGAAGAD